MVRQAHHGALILSLSKDACSAVKRGISSQALKPSRSQRPDRPDPHDVPDPTRLVFPRRSAEAFALQATLTHATHPHSLARIGRRELRRPSPTCPTYATYLTYETYPTYPTYLTYETYPTYPTHQTYATYLTYPPSLAHIGRRELRRASPTCPPYRVSFRYLIRCGWSAAAPRRRFLSAS